MSSATGAMKGWRPAAVATLRRFTYLVPRALSRRLKGRAELFFWRAELERYVRWYDGEPLYGVPGPSPEQRVTGHSREVDAALTFLRVYQFNRYRKDLDLERGALRGKRVLDVGCGPFPSLLVFEGCEPHGIDPLVDRYEAAGYPLDLWRGEGYTYHAASAERMPFPDAHFDAVVSVNAIDHVDDLAVVADEIRRVLRPGGMLRLQLHYHRPTVTEPVTLDDAVVQDHFGWARDLSKLKDTAYHLEGERLTLWTGHA
jgi:SAM-dependent methyltransferase